MSETFGAGSADTIVEKEQTELVDQCFRQVERVFLQNKQSQNSQQVQAQNDLAWYNLFSKTYFDLLIDPSSE